MGKGRGRGKGTSRPGAVIDPECSSSIVGCGNVRIIFQNAVKEKSIVEAYILALALGMFGAHHFYLGRTGYGIAYFFTFGLLGVGYVVDLFRIPCLVADTNKKLRQPETQHEKSTLDAYVLWFPFGLFGFHHFYLRDHVLGLLYFFSLGAFGIGWLIDAIMIPFLVNDINRRVRSNDPELLKKHVCVGYLFLFSPVGILGGHHYYLNRPLWGLLYTFTFGLCGVGWLYDWFRIPILVKRANELQSQNLTETETVQNGEKKYLDDAYILLFPLGFTGLHHFYLRRYGWGALYWFTFGVLGIGYLIDFFRLPCLVSEYNKTRDENRRNATNFLSTHRPGGAAVIPVTSTAVPPQGVISGSVMAPPPQAYSGAYSAYPPQQLGGVNPAIPGASAPDMPPSYSEAVETGTGNDPYQVAMSGPQSLSQNPPAYQSAWPCPIPGKTK